MKKISFVLIILAVLIIFSFYLARKSQRQKIIIPPPKTCTLSELLKDKESCLNNGGKWAKIGLSPKESCNIPTTDADKECFNQEDCEGACLAALSYTDRQKAMRGGVIKTKGKCTPWLITVGCQARVEKGQVSGILCVD